MRPCYAVLAEQVASGFVAVLIVTCLCALVLATPVALAVSAGYFIDLGVLPLPV
jgi:cation transport ATPase